MAVTSPRATARFGYQVIPFWPEDDPEAFNEWLRDLATSVNGIFDGNTNALGSVTLTNSSTTTTLTDPRISINSVIKFMATTADAKTEGEPWVSGRGNGTCTLNHTSDTTTRSYDYVLFG